MKLQPVKTEYRGVVFRSKSEAVFAYTLQRKGVVWYYEPQSVPGGHSWDFLVFWPWHIPNICVPDRLGRCYEGPDEEHYLHVFIEYKPANPSSTYIARLSDQVTRLESGKNRLHFVVFGSPWDQCCDYISLPERQRNGVAEEVCGNFLIHRDEGKAFRFDLSS